MKFYPAFKLPLSNLIFFWSLMIIVGCSVETEQAKFISGDVATDWNETVMTMAVAEDGLLTLKGLRCTAMMHLAMHDALNAIDRRYSPYAYKNENSGADPLAAAAQAAYQVALSQYPNEKAQLDALLKKWLAAVGDGAAKAQGITLGKATAAAILKLREDDRWNGEAEYTWHPMGPGVYAEFHEHSGTPEGFVFGAGWAAARPFMLNSPDHFRSPPPPAIDSPQYAEAFNEVKAVGSSESTIRTADQAHLAMWWKDFVENSHNRLARQLIKSDNLDLWDVTRTLALLNMSVYDAYINVFDNKFFYNHWRPYTAIRWAANDGNPQTEADPGWNNLHHHTYAFPSYPSAHGTAGSAAMTILGSILGDDYPFTMTTRLVDKAGPMGEKVEMNPPTRSFGSFSEAALECSMSRLYLGIHFRYDSIEGNRLGTKIGNYGYNNFLRPVKE